MRQRLKLCRLVEAGQADAEKRFSLGDARGADAGNEESGLTEICRRLHGFAGRAEEDRDNLAFRASNVESVGFKRFAKGCCPL